MNSPTVSADFVLGRDNSAITSFAGAAVHRDIVAPLSALQADAATAGFDLRVVSGYRSFDRQRAIWNAKARGQRAVLDSAGCALDISLLSQEELVHAILRWSALPGASRHHWGCDIDVYDAAAVADDYAVQLSPQEVADDGVFGAMHQWLDRQFVSGGGHGFFRPYNADRGGIAPERWHLSYAPLSVKCELTLSVKLLAAAVAAEQDFALQETVLTVLDAIYSRYVAVPSSCYPAKYVAELTTRKLV
ncbi:M15 family metallopeptidase [Zhongshania guokunii]|uniref:M15 family metallopeptidase n=1 Tax=Zhongshania guokunii TaxID=641783 RepID=A0ABV3U829_9GAMM